MAKKRYSGRGGGSSNGGGRSTGKGGSGRGGNGGGGGGNRRRRRSGYRGNSRRNNGERNGEAPQEVDESELFEGVGLLELHPNGYGFLRSPENNYARERTDPFVPGTTIENSGCAPA